MNTLSETNMRERMKTTFKTKYSTGSVGKYLGIAFGWAWALWAVVILVPGIPAAVKNILIFTGVYGPFMSAIICLLSGKNEEPLGAYLKRAFQVKAPAFIYAIALFIAPAAVLLGWLLCYLYLGAVPKIDSSISILLINVVALFLINTLPEEIGWRGYLMDKLQAKWSPLKTSVYFGIIWGIWHFPLFFVPGFIQNVYVTRIPGFWAVFMLITVSTSVIYVYLYNRTNRSVFLPALFHTVFNLMTNVLFFTLNIEQADFVSTSPATVHVLVNIQLVYVILLCIVGLVIAAKTGGKLGIEHNRFFIETDKE